MKIFVTFRGVITPSLTFDDCSKKNGRFSFTSLALAFKLSYFHDFKIKEEIHNNGGRGSANELKKLEKIAS